MAIRSGIRRQGLFVGGVKQSLLLELLLQLLKGHVQVPHPLRGQLGRSTADTRRPGGTR